MRRGFYDLAKTKAPIAIEALQRIAALYAIEARVRGKTAAERLAVRQAESKPLVGALRIWFDGAQIAKLPARGPTAEAIRYALNHWDGLRWFLEDGRIEIDSNSIERAMRPVSLSRKNSLFAGSDEGGENWACLASLIETCKLNRVNPQAYFADLLTRLVNGWPQNRINELMPWTRHPTPHPEASRSQGWQSTVCPFSIGLDPADLATPAFRAWRRARPRQARFAPLRGGLRPCLTATARDACRDTGRDGETARLAEPRNIGRGVR